MNKIFKLMLIATITISSRAYGYGFEYQGLNYICDDYNYTATVTYTSCSISKSNYPNIAGSIYIPETIEKDGETYTVTSIDMYAFQYVKGLYEVHLPKTVTTIWDYAFNNCYDLQTIEPLTNVKTIRNFAFNNCSELVNFSIADAKNLQYIGFHVFDDCDNLQFDFKIYDNAKYIGTDDNPYFYLYGPVNKNITTCTVINDCVCINGFISCENLTSVYIPTSVQHICYEPFITGAFSGTNATLYMTKETFDILDYNCGSLWYDANKTDIYSHIVITDEHATGLQEVNSSLNIRVVNKTLTITGALDDIVVYDLSGTMILREKPQMVNSISIKSGMYIITIGKYSKKILL